MNGIIGMTSLILDTELTAEQSEYLDMVKISADSLLGLLNDILDTSKIEAGRLDLEAVEFGLRELIESTLKPMGIRASQKGLALRYKVGPEPHRRNLLELKLRLWSRSRTSRQFWSASHPCNLETPVLPRLPFGLMNPFNFKR